MSDTENRFCFTQDGRECGPVSGAQLKKLAGSGRIRPTDKVKKEGMENWVSASTVKGLFPVTRRPSSAEPQNLISPRRTAPASAVAPLGSEELDEAEESEVEDDSREETGKTDQCSRRGLYFCVAGGFVVGACAILGFLWAASMLPGDMRASTQRAANSTEDNRTDPPVETDALWEAQKQLANEKQRQSEIARQRADDERRKLEEDHRREKARQQILAQLAALPEAEQREREPLLTQISEFKAYIFDVQQHLAKLQSDIQGLQLDVQLGRAFGSRQSMVGTSREKVLQLKLQEFKEYQTSLSEIQATLRQTEERFRALPVRYEQERNRLLAKLAE